VVSPERWQTAQQYERGYWEALARQISAGAASQLDWYRWRAQQLVKRLRALDQDHLTTGQARVVEVGSGPVGLVAFFPAAEAIAVDPLERFYTASAVLPRLRNPAVAYRDGVGEHLPCESSRYDLAIMENCIDHVLDMQAVLEARGRALLHGELPDSLGLHDASGAVLPPPRRRPSSYLHPSQGEDVSGERPVPPAQSRN